MPEHYGSRFTNEMRSVTCYATATGSLSLVHHHPKDSQVTVAVDVNLLLETITSDNLRAGELVNVIGYITAKKAVGPCDKPRQRPMQVSVQALVLWSAGSIDIQRYERYLDVYQKS